MELHVIDHPLCAVRLGILRDKNTSNSQFRAALKDTTQFLIYEATRDMMTVETEIDTPLCPTRSARLAQQPLLVPVLRAGLGMVDQAHYLIPESSVGFVGMQRDENTHEPIIFYQSLPDQVHDREIFILDPMIATGNSIVSTVELLADRGAQSITVIAVVASNVGVKKLEELGSVARLYVASVDEALTDDAYVLPGLGDAGDRQFGAYSTSSGPHISDNE